MYSAAWISLKSLADLCYCDLAAGWGFHSDGNPEQTGSEVFGQQLRSHVPGLVGDSVMWHILPACLLHFIVPTWDFESWIFKKIKINKPCVTVIALQCGLTARTEKAEPIELWYCGPAEEENGPNCSRNHDGLERRWSRDQASRALQPRLKTLS